MAKEKQIQIEVRDKIATFKSKNFNLVGGNSDYDVVFDFDKDWEAYPKRTAVFVFGKGKPVYQLFEGNVCEGVAINDATMCLIGVFSGDLVTTTPAAVDCVYRSILDEANGTPEPPSENVYNQIIELINKYIEAIDIEGKYAPLVDGKVPAENLPLMYDFIITSQEQFLSEKENFQGKKVLVKDADFTLRTMDLNGAEYVEFSNVVFGNEDVYLTIKNFKIGNFIGLRAGIRIDGNFYYCDDFYIQDFVFVKNLIPPDSQVHGSGYGVYYRDGFGIMNCAITGVYSCCNIINSHIIGGRHDASFQDCNNICNLCAKDFTGAEIFFERCTNLSNIALSGAKVTYIDCSKVDGDTCDGCISDKEYVDGLFDELSSAINGAEDELREINEGGIVE
ncbi:MAG: hypothetical protein J6J71_04520 [Prevotella sp.]|nr:hypothetical protein [Prevotella sp.]